MSKELHMSLHDLWHPEDPYLIEEHARAAWEGGVSPKEFLQSVFAPDPVEEDWDDSKRSDFCIEADSAPVIDFDE